MSSLSGKVVLITGGARGIGAELVRRLRGAGAQLVLTDLDEAPLAELAAELGDDHVLTALADVGDLTDHLVGRSVEDRQGGVGTEIEPLAVER